MQAESTGTLPTTARGAPASTAAGSSCPASGCTADRGNAACSSADASAARRRCDRGSLSSCDEWRRRRDRQVVASPTGEVNRAPTSQRVLKTQAGSCTTAHPTHRRSAVAARIPLQGGCGSGNGKRGQGWHHGVIRERQRRQRAVACGSDASVSEQHDGRAGGELGEERLGRRGDSARTAPVTALNRSLTAPQAPGWAALCSASAVPTLGLRMEGSRWMLSRTPTTRAVLHVSRGWGSGGWAGALLAVAGGAGTLLAAACTHAKERGHAAAGAGLATPLRLHCLHGTHKQHSPVPHVELGSAQRHQQASCAE